MGELRYRYFVTALIGALLVGLAWGAITQWSPKDSAEVASWVQAFGGIVAVFFAATMPYFHIRDVEGRKRSSQLRVMEGLAKRVIFLLDELRPAIVDDAEALGYIHGGVTAEWDDIGRLLDTFPIWDLADHDLATQIALLRGALRSGRDMAHGVPLDAGEDVDEAVLNWNGCRFTVCVALDEIQRALNRR